MLQFPNIVCHIGWLAEYMVLRWEKGLYKSSEDELVAVLGAPLLVQPQIAP